MSTVADIRQLLNECGEDMSCGCGCPEEGEDSSEVAEFVGADMVLAAIEEARRRRIGLKQFRRIRQMRKLTSGRGSKLRSAPKMKTSIRKSAAHNRHR